MSHPNPSTALARVVVDELAANGVRFLAIAPGSRSAALAIAAEEHAEVETRVVIDERSAAFHALGVARASGNPAGVLATSGTAPANFFPAVVEADMSCVPLVVISADRPPELQGVGANQTIDQVELFGAKVRSYTGIDAPGVERDGNEGWRQAIRAAVGAATGVRPGPVHINVAFREPTVPVSDDGRMVSEPYPFPTPRLPNASKPATVRKERSYPALEADRGVIVAGDGAYDREKLLEVAEDLGWPILATALSGLRGSGVVSRYHFLLAAGVPEDLAPSTAVAIGAIGPDQVLEHLVATASERVRVDDWGRIIDPGRNATSVIDGDPIPLLGSVSGKSPTSWRETWLTRDHEIGGKVDQSLDDETKISGGVIARTFDDVDWGALVVGSSLPIREVDAHLTRSGPVFGNRGASGIDGFVSTALGVASVIRRTIAFCGDLSFLHDSNGFLHDGSIDLTIVVADNGGGGLFDSLPPARHAPAYERLFVTDPRRDLQGLVEFHGATAISLDGRDGLLETIEMCLQRSGVDVVIAGVDRQHDLEVRSRSYL